MAMICNRQSRYEKRYENIGCNLIVECTELAKCNDLLRTEPSKVGGPNVRMGELAKMMSVEVTALGPRRTSLIRKGMIYSPTYGKIAFTVPMLAEFLRRNPRI